jgi:hypothetical protein
VNAADEFEVVLRRSNGRFVKSDKRPSRYAAKQLRHRWEEKYDETFYVEVVPLSQPVVWTDAEVGE